MATQRAEPQQRNLTEAEVRWLVAREWALKADDILWRRSKIGLRLNDDEVQALTDWLDNEFSPESSATLGVDSQIRQESA